MIYIKQIITGFVIALIMLIGLTYSPPHTSALSYKAFAAIPAGCPGGPDGPPAPGTVCPGATGQGTYYCGSGKSAVQTSINFGCKGKSCKTSNANGCSAILDATFAVIRFLSDGAGLVLVLAMIIAGIQFTASRGEPQLRAKALGRVYHVVIALFVFVFAYAILNYVIPAGFFQ